jgi:hypothetical protein
VEKSGRKKYITEGMEEVPESGKESSHSAHANRMNEWMNYCKMPKPWRTNGSSLLLLIKKPPILSNLYDK